MAIVKNHGSRKQFVSKLYGHLLDRDYEQEGFDFWINNLNETSNESFLRQIYELFFEDTRTANTALGEFDTYLQRLNETDNLTSERKSIIIELLTSEKFNTRIIWDPVRNTLDNNKNVDFIISLYRILLNREPDSPGFDFYVDKLENKVFTREFIVQDFLNGAEFNSIPNVNLLYADVEKPKRAFVVDQFLGGDEYNYNFETDDLFINSLYVKLLDRSPDKEGYDYWMNLLKSNAKGGREARYDIIRQFLHSKEFKVGKSLVYSLINDQYENYDAYVSKSKTSHLVNTQVPEFVRQDHRTFIQFLEEYYKFLEQRGQVGNILKSFTNNMNVDRADEQFLQKLYDNFIALVPANVLADRKLILKHAKEFYRSRGTEKSVRFLMRILFDKEVEVYYPKTDVLKASDGKWYVEKSLKLRNLRVNGVSNTDMSVFNYFINKQVVGNTSNAMAAVESVESYYDKGSVVTELKLSGLTKGFTEGETITTQFEENGEVKTISAELYSGVVTAVTIIKKGSGYVEGTTIPLESNTGSGAQIVISKTSRASMLGIIPAKRGAGFRVDDFLLISGGNGTGANANVFLVFDDGVYHPNSYNIVASTINLEANTPINAQYYANLNPILEDPHKKPIKDSMFFWTYANTGPVKEVLLRNPGSNYSTFPDTLKIIANSVIVSLGILGKMEIVDGGRNYRANDVIEFINPYGSYGTGALAKVTKVDSSRSNAISEVKFVEMDGHIIGGTGYSSDLLPIANVVSNTGIGADIRVTATLGSGDQHVVSNTSLIGAIEEVIIVDGGSGYEYAPTLNLKSLGDGTAQAFSTIITGEFVYPGRFLSDDGKLSGYNFIQDRDYYQDYSYVLRVDEHINKWRKPLYDLVHPAGMKVYNEYPIITIADDNVVTQANSHNHNFRKGTYTTTSRGLVQIDEFVTNLNLSTANGCLDAKVLYLDQWAGNSNVWFDDAGSYYVKIYEYESQIVGTEERSNVVILKDSVPGQINGLPLRIIEKANICNVTITLTNHGLLTNDNVFLQFLPNYQNERKNVIVSFVTSNEYYDKHGSSETSYVKSLYKNLLYREGDKEGISYWTGNLHSGNLTRVQVATSFVNASEFDFNYTSYTLLYETDNGDFVSTLYQRYLERNPEDEGYVYWIGQLTNTANNLKSGIYKVERRVNANSFVTINTNTGNHSGNVMVAKA